MALPPARGPFDVPRRDPQQQQPLFDTTPESAELTPEVISERLPGAVAKIEAALENFKYVRDNPGVDRGGDILDDNGYDILDAVAAVMPDGHFLRKELGL